MSCIPIPLPWFSILSRLNFLLGTKIKAQQNRKENNAISEEVSFSPPKNARKSTFGDNDAKFLPNTLMNPSDSCNPHGRNSHSPSIPKKEEKIPNSPGEKSSK